MMVNLRVPSPIRYSSTNQYFDSVLDWKSAKLIESNKEKSKFVDSFCSVLFIMLMENTSLCSHVATGCHSLLSTSELN